jgi:hypothetical protein
LKEAYYGQKKIESKVGINGKIMLAMKPVYNNVSSSLRINGL